MAMKHRESIEDVKRDAERNTLKRWNEGEEEKAAAAGVSIEEYRAIKAAEKHEADREDEKIAQQKNKK